MRFALDAYRRFIQMFGKIVMDVPGEAFEDALDAAKERKGEGAQDTDLDADDLEALIERVPGDLPEHTGEDFPQDPREQLRLAIEAVFKSWNGKRAVDYRRQNKISDDLGTAVNVEAMVFGNRGEDSGTGVAFTRDPSTGEKVPYGDYLPTPRARTSWPASATRCRSPSWRTSTRVLRASSARRWTRSSGTTATCATSSSRSRRDALDPPDAGREAHRVRRVGHGPRHAGGGPDRRDEALLRVDANRLEELFKRRINDEAARAGRRSRKGSTPRPAPRSARSSSPPTRPRSAARRGSPSSWSAERPRPTTTTA